MTDLSNEQPPQRTAGKRGVHTLSGPEEESLFLLTKFADEPTPVEPTEIVNVTLLDVIDYGMDDNDKEGCCGAAMADHGIGIQGQDASLFGQLGLPTFTPGVLGAYWAYGIAMGEPGPEPDQGVDNETWLKWGVDNGLWEAFARVPKAQWREAMRNFRGVCLELQLQDSAEQDFEASPRVPWGTDETDFPPDPREGHDTYGVIGNPDGSGTLITWGGLQDFTPEFVDRNVTGVYVFVSKELADANGVDLDALTQAIASWGGTGTISSDQPPVDPAPVPEPVPAPEPVVTQESWFERAKEEAERIEADVVHDVERVVEAVDNGLGRTPQFNADVTQPPAPRF